MTLYVWLPVHPWLLSCSRPDGYKPDGHGQTGHYIASSPWLTADLTLWNIWFSHHKEAWGFFMIWLTVKWKPGSFVCCEGFCLADFFVGCHDGFFSGLPLWTSHSTWHLFLCHLVSICLPAFPAPAWWKGSFSFVSHQIPLTRGKFGPIANPPGTRALDNNVYLK